jgi:hypothetical protein
MLSVLLILVEIFAEFGDKADNIHLYARCEGAWKGVHFFQLLDHYTYPHLVNITQLPKKIYSCVLRKQILIFCRRFNFIFTRFCSCLLKSSNTEMSGQVVGEGVGQLSKSRLPAHIPEFDAHTAGVTDVCDGNFEKRRLTDV